MGKIACQGTTPVCQLVGNALAGTYCSDGRCNESGVCARSVNPYDCGPCESANVTDPCHQGRLIPLQHDTCGAAFCLDVGWSFRPDGTSCGGGSSQCGGGACACSQLGADAGCSTAEICDRAGDGGFACYRDCPVGQPCIYAGGSHGEAMQPCQPRFDSGGAFAGGRCTLQQSGGTDGAACAANADCRADFACAGNVCRAYCDLTHSSDCYQSTCTALGNGNLGYCKP